MRTFAVVKYLLVCLIIGALVFLIWMMARPHPPATVSVADDANTAFTLVEVADRSLHGMPAIALNFSLPLNPDAPIDQYIQVFEMPKKVEKKAGANAHHSTEEESHAFDEEGQNKETSSIVSTKVADIDFTGGKLVKGAWVVGDNPRMLYFPHIQPEVRYIVQVKAGLPAKNGRTLYAQSRYSILTSPVSPAYYFASNGMVLPAEQNGGLPIVTVNVPEVDVQFLKVKEDQLPRFLDRVINGKKRLSVPLDDGDISDANHDDSDEPDWMRTNLHGATYNYRLDDFHQLAQSVYIGRFVTEQTKNKRSVTHLPIETIEALSTPGVYIAVMSEPGRFGSEYQTTYFYVSDIGLHARLYDKAANVFVSSLINGRAVQGVEISWLDQQAKVLSKATSDANGQAAFALQPKGAKVLMAKKGAHMSLIALKEPGLDLSEFSITGDPYKPTRLFAYAGRNLYRPGESFTLSVLARDADGRPVPTQPIQAILKGPDGRETWRAMWQEDAQHKGYYRHIITLPPDAATGVWRIALRTDPADPIAGSVFSFHVEEFLPERMKLDLKTSATILTAQTPYTIDVTGSYLYGAPAAGNKLLGVVQFERNINPVAQQYPGFLFGDVNEDSDKLREELPEEVLNTAGQSRVRIDLAAVKQKHSPYSVRTTFSLLETNGRPVVRSLERTVWPSPALVGIRPLFLTGYAPENSLAGFEIIRVNAQGKLQTTRGLPVRLFHESRDYYWRFTDQGGWQSGFTETEELVTTDTVTIQKNIRGKLNVPVKYGRYRLEITDPETNQLVVYRFYAGWSAKDNEDQGNRPDKVQLKLDKDAYHNKDVAQLTITPPHDGEALITVEADKTLWLKRMPVSTKGTTVAIPIDPTWLRHDLYITVAVLRPGNAGDRINDVTPARALGITPLPLNRLARELNVAIEAPLKVKPETATKVVVKIPPESAQDAWVTLSAVDVGILNVTQFVTPNPFDFFFAQLHYGADIHDIYGRLIEKMAGQQARLKFGGDNTPQPGKDIPKKVKLIDVFSGPVRFNAKGEAEIVLNIPDFNGTLRLMASVSRPEAFGAAEKEMVVAAPVVAEIATPRFLSLGDQASIALDVTNLSGQTQSLSLMLEGGPGFVIKNEKRQVTLSNQEKTTMRFVLTPRGELGLQPLTLRLRGDGVTLDRQFFLAVQAPTQQQTIKERYGVEGKSSLPIKKATLMGLVPSSVLGHIVVSSVPPIDVRAAIKGLLDYPYGCAEQTASTAYPFLFVDERVSQALGLKPYSREAREARVQQAIARLSAMQAPNGGFSLWGNASDNEYWLSAYIANFFIDAREQGFMVPDALFNRSIDFLLRGLQEGVARLPAQVKGKSKNEAIWPENKRKNNSRFDVLAFGGYVLARLHKAPLSSLRQLYDVRQLAIGGLSLTELGIALKQMGDHPRSEMAIQEGVKKPRAAGYGWFDYGSVLRDAALTYSLLSQYQIKVAGQDNLLATINDAMNQTSYYSTQEKFALFQVGKQYVTDKSRPWQAEMVSGGHTTLLSSQTAGSPFVFQTLSAQQLVSGLSIQNNATEKIWVELSMTGNPIKPLPNRSDVIQLKRTWYTANGKVLANRPLKVGESLVMHLAVTATSDIGTGLVVDRIPAGFEIENTALIQGEADTVTFDGLTPSVTMQDYRIKHVEFRDDRFVAAARLGADTLHLFYRVRVVTPGKYIVPALYAEDMYRPTIYGSLGGAEIVTITDN